MTSLAAPILADLNDQELINLVRAGEVEAYGELFDRHRAAAHRVASYLAGPSGADDLVAEAFAGTLMAIQGGNGPAEAFRPYIYTAIRNQHGRVASRAERQVPTDDFGPFLEQTAFVDDPEGRFDNAAIGRAFRALPERWQSVLWLTAVEELPLADVAHQLGLKANGVAQLAFRAREGLRQQYLTQHLAGTSPERCRSVVGLLPALLRGTLRGRQLGLVEDHLRDCRECTGVMLELQEVNEDLRAILLPLVLGPAAEALETPSPRSEAGQPGASARLAVYGLVAAWVLMATATLGLVTLVSTDDRGVSASSPSDVLSLAPDQLLPAPRRPHASVRQSERAFEPRSLPDPVPVAPETSTPTAPLPTPGSGSEPPLPAQPSKGPGPALADATSPDPPTPPVPQTPPTAPPEPTTPPTEEPSEVVSVDVSLGAPLVLGFEHEGQAWLHVEFEVGSATADTTITLSVDPVDQLEMHTDGSYAAWGCTEEQGPPAAQLSCGLVAPGSESTVLAFDVLVSDSAVLTATATTEGAVDPNPADNTIIAELAGPWRPSLRNGARASTTPHQITSWYSGTASGLALRSNL